MEVSDTNRPTTLDELVGRYETDCVQRILARTQLFRQSLHTLIGQMSPVELQRRMQALEGENWRLRLTLTKLEHDQGKLQAFSGRAGQWEGELLAALNEAALHLAQAYKLRPGTEGEISDQFKAKGIQETTIRLILERTNFLQGVDHFIRPRRSDRLSKSSKSPDGEGI